MKRVALSILLSVISLAGFSQSWEWEIANIGIPFGHQEDSFGNYLKSHDRGFALGTEVRYNWKESNLSTGLQFTFTGWNRRVHNQDNDAFHQNPFIFLVVTDYNYKDIHPNLLLFGGIGCGYSVVRSKAKADGFTDSHMKHFACSPRIGIECFKRARLTFEYQYIGNDNSFFNLKLGFVIGS